jgi:glycerol-3-phosphate acyltransferase PlsY
LSATDLVAVAAAYLLGSVPFGFLAVRLRSGEDIRRKGSGNIGATNVLRQLGPGMAALTLALDAGKGAAAVFAASALGGAAAGAAALAAVLGHLFPPWLGFRGGKGAATGAGAFGVLWPIAMASTLAVFLVALALSRRVSAGSIAAAGAFPVAQWWFGASWRGVVLGAMAAALVLWSHHANLRRLARGTEEKLVVRRASGAPRRGGGS